MGIEQSEYDNFVRIRAGEIEKREGKGKKGDYLRASNIVWQFATDPDALAGKFNVVRLAEAVEKEMLDWGDFQELWDLAEGGGEILEKVEGFLEIE